VLSEETSDDTGVITSILIKILKTVIIGYQYIKVICTCSHKTASLETRRQNAAEVEFFNWFCTV
jgi:hypothetical protein